MNPMLRTLRLASQTSHMIVRKTAQPAALRSLRPSVYANLPSLPVHYMHSGTTARASAGDPMHGIDPNHPFIQKLRDNPHIVQQLADFTILLQEKGLDVSGGKQPGFGQVCSTSLTSNDQIE